MLGFGHDDDADDVAVKNPDPEPDPEDAKTPITRHLIMPLNRLEHREMIPLAHQPVLSALRYLA